jgi:hypothetical protein
MSVMTSSNAIQRTFSSPGKARLAVYAALIIALVNGIIYMAVIPPWQHYDEPNHFEYAWLLANRPGLPKIGDYDLEMRRALARSMVDHNFFINLGFLPDLNSTTTPAYIGPVSQLDGLPLYYLIASIPLRLFSLADPYQNIDWQYRSVQLMSLLLYLATIFGAWGLVREVFGAKSPLVWMVPICLALLPSFNSSMTSINDDVGAIIFFTYFLWGAVYLIQRGFSWKGLVWCSAGAAACFLTKSNVYFAAPLLLVAVLLSLVPTPRRAWVWGGLGAAGLVVLFITFAWGDASDWDRATFQPETTRIQSNTAPLGSYVFQLSSQENEITTLGSSLQQIVGFQDDPDLAGQAVTLGAWIWANQPTSIRAPMIQTYKGVKLSYKTIQVTLKPTFFTFTTTLPANTALLQVNMSPFYKAASPGKIVYYDGIVLVKGQRPAGEQPQFSDTEGTSGTWGGAPFDNLVRNGSAEQAWPQVRSWVDRIGSKLLPDQARPSIILYALLNLNHQVNYNFQILVNLVRTFWAKFGWDKVAFLGGRPYRILAYCMLVGLVGSAYALWRYRRQAAWHVLIFLGLATLVLWMTTYFRGPIYIFYGYFSPPARYGFPVIVPTLMLLVGGWTALAPARIKKYVQAGIPLVFLLINIYALVSIYLFYVRE